MNAIKAVRNNWKKSVLISALAAYGVHYAQKKYHESVILKAYCIEAKKYGDVIVRGANDRPRRVTVFLNPAASRGKGKALYEKNAAPLLHLAGLEVTVVLTEYEGQAKQYMDVLDSTDAILVAGGNGTLAEVITGLLRRADADQFSKVPVGVIPLGKANTLAKSLCPETVSTSVFINEMAMSVIRGFTKPADVIHIKTDDEKSVYAMLGVDWGAFTDAEIRKKKNWYFGPLKHRLAYIISTIRYWPPTNEASLSYVRPCNGCNRCYVPPPVHQWKWWHLLITPRREIARKDYSGIVNDECGRVHSERSTLTQLTARTNNCVPASSQAQGEKSISLVTIGGNLTRTEFIKRGIQRLGEADKLPSVSTVSDVTTEHETNNTVQEFTLTPVLSDSQKVEDRWLYVDDEQFELKNISCRLLPDKIRLFFSDTFTVPLNGMKGRLLEQPVQ